MSGGLRKPRETGLYVAAFVGSHCAFLPLLSFLLPARVEQLSDDPITDVSLLLVAGGIVASIANIAAGRLSDHLVVRHGSRRLLAVFGLAATFLSLSGFAFANSVPALLTALVIFQLSLNLLFAPLVAVLADYVPDERKGITAAWLNIALPAGTLATALSASLAGQIGSWIFPAVALAVVALVLPFLRAWPAGEVRSAPPAEPDRAQDGNGRDFVLAWFARLCIQFGAAVVLSYLYLYLVQFDEGDPDLARGRLAQLTFWSTPLALVAGVAVGRFSDKASRRRPALVAASLLLAGALGLLVAAQGLLLAGAAFVLFMAGLTVFLALDGALIAQLLKGSARRGWALGWMNLTNTLPAIGAPLVTIGFAVASPDPQTIRLSLAVAAGAALLSAGLLWRISSVR